MGCGMNDFVVFKMNEQNFAIEISNVIEITDNKKFQHLPLVPKDILGIINFRGNPVSLINMYKKLNISNFNENFKIIIIKRIILNIKYIFALTVDSVNDIVNISENDFISMNNMKGIVNVPFFCGMFKYNNEIVSILNIEKII